MIWGCMTTFGLETWYKIEGRMDLGNFLWSLYKITFWIQVGWSFNKKLFPNTQAKLCKNGWHHNHFNSFNGLHDLQMWFPLSTSRQFSNGDFTNLQHLPKVSNNYGSMCVQCIPILMNNITWSFMKTYHKELMMCSRVRVIGLFTKDFVGNLNKTNYPYIIYDLALQHTFLLSM